MKQKINEVEINGTIYVPRDSVLYHEVNTDGLQMVLVRTYSAGVHYGYLKSKKYTPAGIAVTLINCRRVWYWEGAATLSQLAVNGTSKPDKCKFPCTVQENEIIAIEIIPMTKKAFESLNSVKIWEE